MKGCDIQTDCLVVRGNEGAERDPALIATVGLQANIAFIW
jgi:hypothetical protein